MTTISTTTHTWTCDRCGSVATVADAATPKGWTWITIEDANAARDLCHDCAVLLANLLERVDSRSASVI